MLHCKDSLEFLKEQEDFSIDVNYSDPPYALGSDVIIQNDNKVEYKKSEDFMSKWEAPPGSYWEEWFNEAYRSTKYGGYCIMFGIDRQLLMFKYYAAKAGFKERQSLYWFFISAFTKSADLSKNIDKHLKTPQLVVGTKIVNYEKGAAGGYQGGIASQKGNDCRVRREVEVTEPQSELGKKYDGYRYSICPLKQTNETIMVFQKPYKSGSCMKDTILMEQGNTQVACGALNIKDNEVNGRYPAQTMVDKGAAEVLEDKSKILNVCEFEKDEHDIYLYSPKVSSKERDAGLGGLEDSTLNRMREDKGEATGLNTEGRFAPKQVKNNHPTLKPISLNEKILRLFKTPSEQRIIYPFAGSGSEIIGGFRAGFTNWSGCEINKHYCDIAVNRINHWTGQSTSVAN